MKQTLRQLSKISSFRAKLIYCQFTARVQGIILAEQRLQFLRQRREEEKQELSGVTIQ